MLRRERSLVVGWIAMALLGMTCAVAAEDPALGFDRITQQEILDGDVDLIDLRVEGLRMFTTLFNKADGYGDGPMDLNDTVTPGGRPTLQGNGTLLRVNGLDGRGCIECHSLLSAATVPPTLGIGGVGGSNANAIIMPTNMEPADLADFDGAADFNGRFANPPFVFGAGGVELLAIEMTEDLQALKAQAIGTPGVPVALITKGVDFGTITADLDGNLDTSGVQGVDADLVVRPFGRKGEFPTARAFDIEAMQFHFGMQPVEKFGPGVDADGDGVTDEVLEGELSALSAFIGGADRPFMERLSAEAEQGFAAFEAIGCTGCHMAELTTRSKWLPLRSPEVETDAAQNVYMSIDLSHSPAGFDRNGAGVTVPLFADLKRHDMGDKLAESFALVTEERNREFTTARLWGVADTAPYLHDGRATTLTEAILEHGGEAMTAREGFTALTEEQQDAVIAFLKSLRVPEDPFKFLIQRLKGGTTSPARERLTREAKPGGIVDIGRD